MFDVTVGVLANLLAFTAIGIGPALILLRSERRFETALAFALQNLRGLEGGTDIRNVFWVGAEPTYLRFVSPIDGEAVLTAEFLMGPSLPERSSPVLTVRSGASQRVKELRVTEVSSELRVPIREGLNELALQATDPPRPPRPPSGDRRPDLLGIQDLTIRCAKPDR